MFFSTCYDKQFSEKGTYIGTSLHLAYTTSNRIYGIVKPFQAKFHMGFSHDLKYIVVFLIYDDIRET